MYLLQVIHAIVPLISPIVRVTNYLLAFYSTMKLILVLFWIKGKWKYHREKLYEKYGFNNESFLATQEWPMVTVQLPMYNERNVVERLIRTIAKLDYPLNKLQIQVLDDSTDETSEIVQQVISTLPKNFPIEHIKRNDRTGFKAGAMDHALQFAKGEFIAIFDADFVPAPDFIKRIVVPFFADPKIAVVQGQWGSLNENDSLLTKIQSIALSNHFGLEQFGKCYGGLFLNFNGTCGAWRKSAIYDAGGWEHDTLIEDVDLSFRAQIKGWKIIYVPDIIVPGEVPDTIQALKLQQYRWAKGGIQAFRKMSWTIIKAPIPIYVKFFAVAQLSGSTIYVWMFLVSMIPVIMMPFQPGYVPQSFFWLGLAGPIVALCCSQISAGKYKNLIYIPIVLAFGYAMMLNGLQAVVDGFLNKGGTFARTPKQGNDGKKKTPVVKAYKARRYPWGEIFFLCVSVYVITFGSVLNPYFYVQHLFYACCYTLMLYFFWCSYIAEDTNEDSIANEQVTSDVNNQSTLEVQIEGNNSHSDEESKSNISGSKNTRITSSNSKFHISALKKSGLFNGPFLRFGVQAVSLVFLFFLARIAVSRFPDMSVIFGNGVGGVGDSSITNNIFGYMNRPSAFSDSSTRYLTEYSSCSGINIDRDSDKQLAQQNYFSEWNDANYLIINCESYPVIYRLPSRPQWNIYYEPVIIKKEEYIIAGCGNKLEFHFRNHLNNSVVRRALEVDKHLNDGNGAKSLDSDSDNVLDINNSNSPNVLLLIIDGDLSTLKSTSQFPKTYEILKNMNININSRVSSFSFENYYSAGLYDYSNEIATLSGCGISVKSSKKTNVADSHFLHNINNDPLFEYYTDRTSQLSMLCDIETSKSRSTADSSNKEIADLWLWNKYQNIGYVSLYGDEECNKRTISTDSNSQVNHINTRATEFFNRRGGLTPDHTYGSHTCERYFVPKCYGVKHMHNDTFSYLFEFWNNYKEKQVSRFAVQHLKASIADSDSSVNGKKILDNQLSTFVNKFYNEENNVDTILAVVGNPTSDSVDSSDKEKRSTLLNIVLPKSFLDRHPALVSTLSSNEQKLVSSYDIYNTFASLPSILYPNKYHNELSNPSWSFNLFTDKVSKSRSCNDARVPASLCSS